MIKLQETEFKAVKKSLRAYKMSTAHGIKVMAHTMKRSVATVTRISASKNYEEYLALVKSEHSPSKPRVPLQTQLRKARKNELLGVKHNIPDGFRFRLVHRYLDNRLLELK